MKIVEKKWGRELWYVNHPLYCCKELVLEPGWACSLHMHKIKTETFQIFSGHCTLEYGNDSRIMSPGEQQTIEPGTYHRFSLGPESKEACHILEVSTHHEDSDSYRLTESQRVQ